MADNSLMFTDKTTEKKPWSSMRIEQSTPRLQDHRSRTQFMPNETVSMHHPNNTTTHYKVFQDRYIGLQGIHGDALPLIQMDADEDCDTTESLLLFGTELCLKDLKNSILIPREQTQTNLSQTSYEDC
jgi:hypothetical protein